MRIIRILNLKFWVTIGKCFHHNLINLSKTFFYWQAIGWFFHHKQYHQIVHLFVFNFGPTFICRSTWERSVGSLHPLTRRPPAVFGLRPTTAPCSSGDRSLLPFCRWGNTWSRRHWQSRRRRWTRSSFISSRSRRWRSDCSFGRSRKWWRKKENRRPRRPEGWLWKRWRSTNRSSLIIGPFTRLRPGSDTPDFHLLFSEMSKAPLFR